MNMMLNSVATDEALPSYIADVRRMVREADEPELMAAYERIDELERLLMRLRFILQGDFNAPGGDEAVFSATEEINDALDQHRVLS